MALPQGHINKIHDSEGKPLRYRRGVYPTLLWLLRHPDRRNYAGLVGWVRFEIGISFVYLLVFGAAAFHGVASYRQTGSVSVTSYVFALVAVAVVQGRYRSARSLMHYAATIDLKTNICPACGYPLTLQSSEESAANSLCTECGRRWTVAPRAEAIEKLQSTPPPGSKTDADD